MSWFELPCSKMVSPCADFYLLKMISVEFRDSKESTGLVLTGLYDWKPFALFKATAGRPGAGLTYN